MKRMPTPEERLELLRTATADFVMGGTINMRRWVTLSAGVETTCVACGAPVSMAEDAGVHSMMTHDGGSMCYEGAICARCLRAADNRHPLLN